MTRRLLIAATIAAVGLAGTAVATPRPPGASAAVRDGYALAADSAPEADGLPRAYGAATGFYEDLDLPDIGQYANEALRFTSTGLSPTLVVQLAVVRPGRPVQVMVVKATGPSHLKEARRVFGALPWSEFVALRQRALTLLLQAPRPADLAAAEPPVADISVSAVDQVCTLEYAGEGLVVRRRADCRGGDAFDPLTTALIDVGEAAARPPAPR